MFLLNIMIWFTFLCPWVSEATTLEYLKIFYLLKKIPILGYYNGIKAAILAQPVDFISNPEEEEIRMMERMRLLSSIFRSKKSLSKEVQPMEEEICNGTPIGFQEGESCSETSRRFQEGEEDPWTSYSHGGSEEKEDHLEHEFLSGYLAYYKC